MIFSIIFGFSVVVVSASVTDAVVLAIVVVGTSVDEEGVVGNSQLKIFSTSFGFSVVVSIGGGVVVFPNRFSIIPNPNLSISFSATGTKNAGTTKQNRTKNLIIFAVTCL